MGLTQRSAGIRSSEKQLHRAISLEKELEATRLVCSPAAAAAAFRPRRSRCCSLAGSLTLLMRLILSQQKLQRKNRMFPDASGGSEQDLNRCRTHLHQTDLNNNANIY